MGTAQALLDKVDCSFDHRKAFSPYQGYVFQYIGLFFCCLCCWCWWWWFVLLLLLLLLLLFVGSVVIGVI